MGVRSGSLEARPPAPRIAFSFRYGARTRTVVLPPLAFYGLVGGATLLAAWYLCATLYLIFRDEMLASLMKREVDMQYGYETRIATLRTQLERETSRQLVDQNTLEVKLRDLASRQTLIENRGAIVAALAQRAGAAMDVAAGAGSSVHAVAAARNPLLSGAFAARALPGDASAFAPVAAAPERPTAVEKPQPVLFDLRGGSEPVTDSLTPPSAATLPESLSSLDRSIDTVADAQVRALAALAAPAAQAAGRIRAAFAIAGLSPDRLDPARRGAAGRAVDTDVGGPFVPLANEPEHSLFSQEAGTLQTALVEVERLRRTLNAVPLRQPLPGTLEVSSPFGPRLDPFLGRPALHTGVDLKGDYGAQVRATAAGKVTNAERDGGYGNMVEIDHGNGLSTRYAHLSSIVVSEGQWVEAGQVLGSIGATGRATGPHLHYETRIDGEAVDPARFLRASARLLPNG